MMHYLTVSQLANALGVTPQGINKYLREQGLQSKAVKKGNKFLIDEPLAETIRNHFRPNDKDILKSLYQTETETETKETITESSETETETSRNDKTAGQAAVLEVKNEQLEIRLQEQKEEIIFLREQVNRLNEKNDKLELENDGMKKQLLLMATSNTSQEQEDDEVINIPFKEEIEINEDAQEQEEIIAADAESIADEPKKQDITLDEYFRMSFFERLKYKWGRDNAN